MATTAPAVARSTKPVMISVDDDPGLSRAVQRDLRRRYGEGFRVLRAESGGEGLELLDQVSLREEPVALLVADQRMPRMTGVEFLERSLEVAPDTKRVLLTAYADTQAAIDAINRAALDHYLLKPWDPPEEQLYPVIDDLLFDWQAHAAVEEGIRVIGHRWSRESHELKDFLARSNVPYPLARRRGRHRRARAAGGRAGRPEAPAGARLPGRRRHGRAEQPGGRRPDRHPHAGRLTLLRPRDRRGWPGRARGGRLRRLRGPSHGARRARRDRRPGGSELRIENYLGFPSGLSGGDLTHRASAQARRFGARMVLVQDAVALEPRGPARTIRLTGGEEISSHAVVVATGVQYRRLEVPGVAELTGRGVYYGGSRSEALSCSDEEVVVVGGANSAGQAALYFARYAGRVTIVYRGPSLSTSMSHYLVERVEAAPNVEVRLSPNTAWLDGVVARDDRGFIMAGPDLGAEGLRPPWPLERDPLPLESSLPGVFVAGDVRHQSIKRVAAAVGDGAMAVQLVHHYLGTLA